MNIAHWLARSARVYPGNPAVSQGSRVVFDYAQLAQRVSALAAGLRQQLALQPGDRVALVMTNSPFYVELLYAAWWGGLTAVPVNAKLHHEEAAYILDHSGAKVCFVSADLAADIGALEGRTGQLARVIEAGYADYHALLQWDDATQPFPVRPDDAAWLFYTSGTTGRPKGVTISHRNIIAMSLCRRPLGRAARSTPDNRLVTLVFVVSTTGLRPLTVIVSSTPPISSDGLIVAMNPTAS